MTTRRYALERGGPRRLEARWRRGFRDFTISLDGAAHPVDRAALSAGATLALPDGGSLFLRAVARRWYSVALRDDLLVERDGVPLPGSDGHPRTIGLRAGRIVLLFGLLRLLLAFAWFTLSREASAVAGGAAAYGLGLAVLAVLAMLGVRWSLAAAAGLLVLEALASAAAAGARVNGLGLLISGLVVAHLVRAWRAMAPRPPTPTLAKVFE